MIYRIYSPTNPKFKTMEFRPGLNIVYVESLADSTSRQTRNRAGKTSLIEIIHWLLGANLDDKTEREQFETHEFGMDFDLDGEKITVERHPNATNKVLLKNVSDATAKKWHLPTADMFGEYTLNVRKDWLSILGRAMFRLQDEDMLYSPSFRTLINYFVRRKRSNGFSKPQQITERRDTVSYQVNITYLLGLDWKIPAEWEQVREKERQLKTIRKAARGGELSKVIGSTAKLRTEIAVTDNQLNILRKSIESFNVHESYKEFEEEAVSIAMELRELSNSNQIDKQLIKELERAIEEERSSISADLEQLYSEVGIVLPQQTLEHFEDVKKFHHAVVQNRRLYLRSQINDAEERAREREKTTYRLTQRRDQVTKMLSSHGALDQLTSLQTEQARLEGKLSFLKEQFHVAQDVEGRNTRLEIEKQQLLLRLGQNYEEQSNLIDRAIIIYEEISEKLYEDAGSFTVELTADGPTFAFPIHGDKSTGVQDMRIFCFDMMLVRLCHENNFPVSFLVHDSNLFDSSDPRQVRNALKVGADLAQEFGFQYIVTMNSHQMYAENESQDPYFDPFIIEPRLNDSETGGLFGYRYG